MRIGTWNLEGHWSAAHQALLSREQCDVWLLTEVSASASLEKFNKHFSALRMTPGKCFSAIFSKAPLRRLPDPHPASAAVVTGDVTFCCSVLPWSTCAKAPSSPWHDGTSSEEMIRETLNDLAQGLPTNGFVWGGDWNQNLIGGWEHVGSKAGCKRLKLALEQWDLQVPTAGFAHRLAGSHSIDHIAVPNEWSCHRVIRVDAASLSDHDAYIVDVEPARSKVSFARSSRHHKKGENVSPVLCCLSETVGVLWSNGTCSLLFWSASLRRRLQH